MKVKKAARRLSLANDINSLSVEELANKYLKSQTCYDRFLKDYAEMFCNNDIYQLRVFDHYNKLKEVVEYGYLMYPSDKNEKYSKALLTSIETNLEEYGHNSNHNDIQDAHYAFAILTGSFKCKHEERYSDVIKNMNRAAKKYDEKKGKGLEDFTLFLNTLQYKVSPEEFDQSLSYYVSQHPLIKECKDIYFLYYANYIISKGNEIDPVFLQDVKDVIEVSKAFDRHVIHPINKFRDYNKVARYTLRNIKRYEDNMFDKEEDYSKKIIK